MSAEINAIDGRRYRSDVTSVTFLVPQDKVPIASLMAAVNLITKSNRKYPSTRAIGLKRGSLYGASIAFDVVRSEKYFIVQAEVSTLSSHYRHTLFDIQKQGQKFLRDLLYEPWTENDDELINAKIILLKRTLDILQHPSVRAPLMLKKTFYPGPSFDEYIYGQPEDIKKIDVASVKAARAVLLQSPRFVRLISTEPQKGKKSAAALFKPDLRETAVSYNLEVSADPADVSEIGPFSQSVVCWAYSFGQIDDFHRAVVSRVANYVLGGPASSSLLFRRLREENGLCYYIDSSIGQKVLVITSGIDAADYRKTLRLVAETVERADELVTPELIDDIKESYRSDIRNASSSASNLISFVRTQALDGYPEEPEKLLDEIEKVGIDEVKEFLHGLQKIGSFAVLGQKEN